MRRSPLVLVVLFALAGWFAWQERAAAPPRDTPSPRAAKPAARPLATPVPAAGDRSLDRAIAAHARDAQVTGSGTVARLLRDDNEGSRHQRFLVDVGDGRTVLIAHNIELAARVEPLRVGDRVEFAGEFEWNDRGGVVHWTHPDPRGRHRAGYVRVAAQ